MVFVLLSKHANLAASGKNIVNAIIIYTITILMYFKLKIKIEFKIRMENNNLHLSGLLWHGE